MNAHNQTMNHHKRVLVLSYYACMPGACQAEWLDDKLDSLDKGGYEVALVSAACAKQYPDRKIRHWRISSISMNDYRDELQRIRLRGDVVRLRDYAMLPLVVTLGVTLDAMQYLLTKGVGEGRWSWVMPSSMSALLLAWRFRPDLVLSTGGPASAHLAGLVVSKLIGVPLVVELQDPLSGGGIGRNEQSKGWLYKVEKLIVDLADKFTLQKVLQLLLLVSFSLRRLSAFIRVQRTSRSYVIAVKIINAPSFASSILDRFMLRVTFALSSLLSIF